MPPKKQSKTKKTLKNIGKAVGAGTLYTLGSIATAGGVLALTGYGAKKKFYDGSQMHRQALDRDYSLEVDKGNLRKANKIEQEALRVFGAPPTYSSRHTRNAKALGRA